MPYKNREDMEFGKFQEQDRLPKSKVRVTTVDKNNRLTEYDAETTDGTYGYNVGINIEHHKIHEGDHFACSDYDADVDTGTPKYWHIKTGQDYYVHLTFSIISSKNGLIEAFKNPTLSANGTALTTFNNNFTSDKVSLTNHYYDPTVTSDGTRVFVQVIGTDGNNPTGNTGGIQARTNEVILQQNSSYLIKYTTETNDNRVSITTEYYDVDKEQ